MNEVDKTLNQLAIEINQIWKTTIFEVGTRLLKAKELLPHGQFIPWIEKNCPFGRAQAHNYMMVTQRKDELLEPPTNLKEAVRELRSIDQMSTRVDISTEVAKVKPEKELPTVNFAADELISKVSKFCNNSPEIKKIMEIMPYKDHLTLHHRTVLAQSLRASAERLITLAKELEND